jgi:hypothetical protein
VEKFINTDRYIPMSTKLQTALCTMTVSMETPRRGRVGQFQDPWLDTRLGTKERHDVYGKYKVDILENITRRNRRKDHVDRMEL